MPSGVYYPKKRPPSVRVRWRVLHSLESWLDTPMLVLSFVWLLLVFAQLVWRDESWLDSFGTVIWVVFILDFVLRLTLAPNKIVFLRGNWIIAIALVVPAIRMFRVLGVVRFAGAAQGIQIVRLVGTVNRTMLALRRTMRRRRIGYALVLTAVVTLLGAAGMLALEPARSLGAGNGFKDYGDALWWTAMIMTTVGSQYWPVTGPGRVLGFLLSVYAIGVFGYVTAAFASFFVGEDARSDEAPIVGARDIEALRREIALLRAELQGRGRMPVGIEPTAGLRQTRSGPAPGEAE